MSRVYGNVRPYMGSEHSLASLIISITSLNASGSRSSMSCIDQGNLLMVCSIVMLLLQHTMNFSSSLSCFDEREMEQNLRECQSANAVSAFLKDLEWWQLPSRNSVSVKTMFRALQSISYNHSTSESTENKSRLPGYFNFAPHNERLYRMVLKVTMTLAAPYFHQTQASPSR